MARTKQAISKPSSTISDSDPSPSHQEKSSAAQKTVLSTPELLVIILSQLPHSSLLKAQRVNKTWASLFGQVEIQASLFKVPRPKGSAFYVEKYSDILMDRFSNFWPVDGSGEDSAAFEETAMFEETNITKNFHPEGWNKAPNDDVSNSKSGQDSSETCLEGITTLHTVAEQEQHECPFGEQWRHLLISQPPIKALELVQEVSQRFGGTLQFRTTISLPSGLTMGLLYSTIKHWHSVERGGQVELLWNRKTGDLIDEDHYYPDGQPLFKKMNEEEEPCLTVSGCAGVGCGQTRLLTYLNQMAPRTQVIDNYGEAVRYNMGNAWRLDLDLEIVMAKRALIWDEEEEL